MSFLQHGLGEAINKFRDKASDAQDIVDQNPFANRIDKARLFYEMETKGNLRTLKDKIVAMEAQILRSELLSQIAGGSENPLVKSTIELLQQDKIEDAERMVKEEMRRNPEETKKIIERYRSNPQQILRALENKEITQEEAQDLAQEALKNEPIIQSIIQKTGFEPEAVSATVAGMFVRTKKIPTNSWDIITSMSSSAQGLMHFRVTGRAAEKIGVEKSSIRAIYSIGVYRFADIVKMLQEEISPSILSGPISQDIAEKLRQRLENPSIKSDERRIIRFLMKDPNNPSQLRKLFEYTTNRENVENSLKELDKTFLKGASLEGKNISHTEIRRKSSDFFRNDATVGNMMEYKFLLKEDRETLVSYTMASLLYTLPRAFAGQMKLKAMTDMFREFSDPKNKQLLTEFTNKMNKSWANPLSRGRKLSKLVEIERLQRSGGAVTEASAEMTKKMAAVKSLTTTGKVLKFAGPGLLAASEVYNISTGRSTFTESVGRFAGGMLRFVPVLGTGLDFWEAISGRDHIAGQDLTGTERLARVGWGVLGAVSDLALLIPGAGIIFKGGVMSARGAALVAKTARATRLAGLGVGVGAGIVAPMVASPEMREAARAVGTVGVTGVKGMAAAFSLLAGPGGGAADMSVAMARLKDKTGDVIESAAEKTVEVAGNIRENSGELLSRLHDKIGGWDTATKTRFEDYVQDSENASRLNGLRELMDRSPDRVKEIFNNSRLSVRERHRRMAEFIERNRSGRET